MANIIDEFYFYALNLIRSTHEFDTNGIEKPPITPLLCKDILKDIIDLFLICFLGAASGAKISSLHDVDEATLRVANI